jgi:decaprenyl-phosphate phosphoribosyltransferase
MFPKLIRISHWSKNLFMFTPLFFSGQFTDFYKLSILLGGFISFCLVASSVYIFNDIFDLKEDRIHAKKKSRPLASGSISVKNASAIGIFLLLCGFMLAAYLNWLFIIVLGIYLLLNILYTMKLKEIAILDVNIIALGFVLRIFAGGILVSIAVSHWLVIMTFLLSLFLAFAKRRDDVIILQQTGEKMRKSVHGYNLDFINSAISLLSAVIIVAYLLYITSPDVTNRFHDKPVYISGIFVILGLLRYLQITLVNSDSGSPTRILFEDRFIQSAILGWILFFVLIIYTF